MTSCNSYSTFNSSQERQPSCINHRTLYLLPVTSAIMFFLQIHSDCAANQQVTYRISGVGIDQPPYGIFIINQKTGEINITSIVDREVTPFFIVSKLNVCLFPGLNYSWRSETWKSFGLISQVSILGIFNVS